MNTLILFPRKHRAEWIKTHPQAMFSGGGISSRDLERWDCDICGAAINPDAPIFCYGGPEGHSLCSTCTRKLQDYEKGFTFCECPGCKLPMGVELALKAMLKSRGMVRRPENN